MTESVQQEISTSRDAVVVTKDSASPLELEQVSTELKLNGHYQRQQRVLRQNCQTRHRDNKLRRRQRKTMLVERKRYQKHRGKMKVISVIMDRWQGEDHVPTQRKSVPWDAKNEPMEGPLQFLHTVRPCRVNRRRRGRIRRKFQPQLPIYQMTPRQMDKLRCDGMSRTIDTGITPKPKCTEMSPNSWHLKQGDNVPRNAKNEPVKSFRSRVDRKVEGRKQLALGDLSEGMTAKQTGQDLLDEDEEGERDEGVKHREGSLCEISLDRMENRQEKVQWNWRKRKKFDLTMEEIAKMEELDLRK
ncbi:MAG: hypothetical protein GY820_06490, partial [Gammaproteobacteria bacterium]|nr:hypothetical protein [Gammaproteobacteria bacterium]